IAEFVAQDGCGMFAQFRWGVPDLRGGGGKFGDRAKLRHSLPALALDGLYHLAGGGLRAVERVGDRVDRPRRDFLLVEWIQPCGCGSRLKNGLPLGNQFGAVRHPTWVDLETSVLP